jgi:leukotriene-A4 hydrolase
MEQLPSQAERYIKPNDYLWLMKYPFAKASLPVWAVVLLFSSCRPAGNQSLPMNHIYQADPHSYARPEVSRVDALALQLEVDFEHQQLRGSATWQLAAEHGDSLVLDTYDLNIAEVLVDGRAVEFVLGSHDPILGQSLSLPLQPTSREVYIAYSTNPGARALQWLEPSQTAGKKQPFLFTQSQAILARTWLPCQDSPGLRYSYRATIKVPEGMMALMSATNPQERSEDGKYYFEMEIPVPAYLMALAVGDIDFKAVGERTGVYAEPGMLKAAVQEFTEMQQMLEAAEALYGPYAWGRYDVLVLPPSFPFGGMENPRLTFATPTIITGDRSLVSLVAHELAHSWSGNLVTNATWDDFWLNEGFTVYFENRIMEAVYGRDYAEMLAGIGYADLLDEIADLEAKNEIEKSSLKANMAGGDPDDGVGPIAYDKGYLLLRLLEETMGRERWDRFLRNYFTENAFGSMHTERFISLLSDSLSTEEAKMVDLQTWIYGTGLPANCPVPSSSRFAVVDASLQAMRQSKTVAANTRNWSTHEWVYFIRSLNAVDAAMVSKLDAAYKFTQSRNAEISCVWYTYIFKHAPDYAKQTAMQQAANDFLVGVGRRKFLMPIYRAMKENGQIELARDIYSRARPNYHAVARQSVDALLEVNG